MYNNSMYGDNQESFPCFSIIYLQSWAKTPQRKYHFTIVCELFTQARDNLFPDSQSQNDNTLLKIWVNVYNYIWYIPQVKHMAIVFLKIYAQQTSRWPTIGCITGSLNFHIQQNANFYFLSIILKFAIFKDVNVRRRCYTWTDRVLANKTWQPSGIKCTLKI